MKDSIFYSVLGVCILASAAMAYLLLAIEPAEEKTVAATAPASALETVEPVKTAVEPEWTCDVTLANYKTLVVGMSYRRARAILGCEGKETFRSDYGRDESLVSYKWDIPGGGYMSASFKNERLTKKTWFD